ncbi:MAG TPA: Spy/CpxP family protein refolding chaperone [Spongiibacteraceae bacterium]|jgi:Spy/CpxP family protein refolding chaperone|nr:Spy/CpxP family protein refolding chaperone [Spongiibacteraceae bacterium]HUH36794.1 Spy/CpxP family protein refolding chaperone [Spongiibacteraceae bacterium]
MNQSHVIRSLLTAGLLGVLAIPGLALAASDNPPGDKQGNCSYAHAYAGPEQRLARLTENLELTAAQQETLKAQFADARTRTSALRNEKRSLHRELHALADSNSYDPQRAAEIAARIGVLSEQLSLEMAQGRQKLWQLLTPVQQQRYNEMKAQRAAKMAEWRKRHGAKSQDAADS